MMIISNYYKILAFITVGLLGFFSSSLIAHAETEAELQKRVQREVKDCLKRAQQKNDVLCFKVAMDSETEKAQKLATAECLKIVKPEDKIACFSKKETEFAQQGHKAWKDSLQKTHASVNVALRKVCPGGDEPDQTEFLNKFIQNIDCRSSALDTMVGDAAAFSSDEGLIFDNFDSFLTDHRGFDFTQGGVRRVRDRHWGVALFVDSCLTPQCTKKVADPKNVQQMDECVTFMLGKQQTESDFQCFRSNMKRVHSELKTASKKWDSFSGKMSANMSLTAQCLRATQSDACLRSIESWFPAYFPVTTLKVQSSAGDKKADEALKKLYKDAAYRPDRTVVAVTGRGSGKQGVGRGGGGRQVEKAGSTEGAGSGTGSGDGVGPGLQVTLENQKQTPSNDSHSDAKAPKKRIGQRGGYSDKPGRGVADGRGDEPCPSNVDCARTPKLDLHEDPGFGGGVWQCDQIPGDLNCLTCQIGQGAGDPTREISKGYKEREEFCRKQLQRFLAVKSMTENLGAETITKSKEVLNKPFDYDAEKRSYACEVLFQDILKWKDSAGKLVVPDIDAFSKKAVEAAQATTQGKSAFTENIGALAQVVAHDRVHDLKKDMGSFSVKERVKTLFSSYLLLKPQMITGEDETSYEQILQSIVGDKSASACLLDSDSETLKSELKSIREEMKKGLKKAEKQNGGKPLSAKTLNENWIIKLKGEADTIKKLEKGSYVLGMMFTRLGCKRFKMPMSGDLTRDISDYVPIGEDWHGNTKQKTYGENEKISVGEGLAKRKVNVYQARLDWFTHKYQYLAGESLPRGAIDEKNRVSCSALAKMQNTINSKLDTTRSANPILNYKPNPNYEVLKPECSYNDATDVRLAGKYYGDETTKFVYGPPDAAAGYEDVRVGTKFQRSASSCWRDADLSDRLAKYEKTDLDSMSNAVRYIADQINKRLLTRLQKDCSKGSGQSDEKKNELLRKEGDGVVCMSPLVDKFMLSCSDLEMKENTTNPECQNRRSYAPYLCSECYGKDIDKAEQEAWDFLKQSGVFVANMAMFMVPGGGMAGRVVMTGLLTTSGTLEYLHRRSAISAEEDAFQHFQNGNIAWSTYQSAAESREVSDSHYLLFQTLNVGFAGLEMGRLAFMLKEYKAGRGMKALAETAASARTAEGRLAFMERAEKYGTTPDDVYRYLVQQAQKNPSKWQPLLNDYMDATRSALLDAYHKFGGWDDIDVLKLLTDPKLSGDDLMALTWAEKEAWGRWSKDPGKMQAFHKQVGEAMRACGYKAP